MREISKSELYNRCNHIVDQLMTLIDNLAVTHFVTYEDFDVASPTWGALEVVPIGPEFEFSRVEQMPRTIERDGAILHLVGWTYVGPEVKPLRYYLTCALSELPDDTELTRRYIFGARYGLPQSMHV